MGKMRYIRIIMLLCVVFMASPSMLQARAAFPDLPATHWAYRTIVWAQEQGIIRGLPNGHAAPDRIVTNAEFIAMINRAFVPGSRYEADYNQIRVPEGSAWDLKDHRFAVHMNWPVSYERRADVITRGEVARLLAAVMGMTCTEDEAIVYLLDNGLAKGKTAPTIQGFMAQDRLTRAEAVTFIHNLHSRGVEIAPRSDGSPCAVDGVTADDVAVRGIAIHDSEEKVLKLLGEPDLVLKSQYGFDWHVYNADYSRYVQVGIRNGQVVGLLTNTVHWRTPDGIGADSVYEDVIRVYGEPLTYIRKGNVRYLLPEQNREYAVYSRDGYYLTFYFDLHDGRRVAAVQLIDRTFEESIGYYAEPGEDLRSSYERQIFELANAARVTLGLNPFEWDDAAAESARKHSLNMAQQQFFDHADPAGRSPFDRMRLEGIDYKSAAENIAYGQRDALQAHMGWMNSIGHRKALLGSYERLGAGVAFSDDGVPYYTQNFYTPSKMLASVR